MDEGIIKDKNELIIKEFQTIITVFYLLLVGVGMIFNYYKYSTFGINIFQYADIFDFLIAPFQDAVIILFLFVSIIVPYFLMKIDLLWIKRSPKSYAKWNFGVNKKSWFNKYRFIVYSLGFILYIVLAAKFYGNYAKVKISNHQPLTLKFIDNQVETGILIGKTNDILFLLQGNDVNAFPISSNVSKIELRKAKPIKETRTKKMK